MSGVVDLVVVGCSWGGLDAATRLLGDLPTDLDAATVVVQHLAERRSHLVDLLDRAVPQPVVDAEDKQRPEPGHVYVAPPGYHLLLDRGRFALSTDEPVHHSRPSIDVLLCSAADDLGERLAGVILTGANSDGAAGLAHVVEMGGHALVQDPATAEKPAMPEAARLAVPGAEVAPIDELARRVVALAGVRARGSGAAR